MRKQSALVTNVQHHMGGNVELKDDLVAIRRIGAIPRYHGDAPPEQWVRGLPNNPADDKVMMTKLRQYVMEGEMFVCTTEGAPPGTRILRSPPTTAEKKLRGRTFP